MPIYLLPIISNLRIQLQIKGEIFNPTFNPSNGKTE